MSCSREIGVDGQNIWMIPSGDVPLENCSCNRPIQPETIRTAEVCDIVVDNNRANSKRKLHNWPPRSVVIGGGKLIVSNCVVD